MMISSGTLAVIEACHTQIRESPALQSLLYDLDLMPEQICSEINLSRMIAVCKLMEQLTLEQVASLFGPPNAHE